MTDSTPPSIPPRQRPTSPSTTGRSTTSSRANPASSTAWTVAPAEPTTPAATGRSTTSGSSKTAGTSGTAPSSVDTSTSHEETTRTVTQPPPAAKGDGAKPPTDRPKPPVRSSATAAAAAAKTRDDTSKPSDDARAREDDDATGQPDGDDQPSPLMVAVDSTTSWLKKVAGATSAAITTASRPRPEDTPMTSIPVATPPASAGTRPVAGANPAGAAARPSTGRIPTVQASSGPRRVRLAISRLDPWSVMKLSFLLSVAIGIMIVVGVAVGWFTLNELHVFTKVDDLVTQVTGQETGGPDILQYVEFQKVISAATLIAVIDVFLLTALSTIGAFLYNIVAALVGGVHVTMTDE
ncbi:DUF3566 domain-containing protein [Cellulomonas edaphi]|uniref:DUF3566 domain-containing protein n=1 Tax=Cellulomonas edaphi TaxID=3053468 RepID=A0ABT7S3G7_9CELL|nr:DUF3566 domain-containing protein [Cellulomons edaphi]MDM7830162.1 DUF3566 domain-containing protein [Cellulomons edaphi]